MKTTGLVDQQETVANQRGDPLSPEHSQEISKANQRARQILRAVSVATFNGYTTSIFAAFSLLAGLFSIKALCVGVGLAIVARNEFHGRKLLRWLDPRGTRLLGWNQVGFIVLLVAYSLWSIYEAFTGPNPFQEYIDKYPELTQMLEPYAQIHTALSLAVYGSVIVASVIVQGLTARYYLKKDRLLKSYLDQTPDWIVELQRGSL